MSDVNYYLMFSNIRQKKTFFYLMNLSISVTTTTKNDHQTRITELFVILLPSFKHKNERQRSDRVATNLTTI